jgi:hypothetical protein
VQKVIKACPDTTEISVLCTYGGLDHWKTIRNQELFAKEVMPYFQTKKPEEALV